MGGRGGSSGMSNSGFVGGLKDSLDFDDFIDQNLSNSDFMSFGRDHSMDEIKDLWRQKRTSVELKDIHEMSLDDAIDQIQDTIPSSVMSGWFRNADSEYKPILTDYILSNPGTLNAGMNIAYNNYKSGNSNPKSFNDWVKTPQTMYRGTHGQKTVASDVFDSYTPDRSIANKFADYDGGSVQSIRIRPLDTWGSFQTTPEQEFLVPAWRRN